jgi:hypothetical protein
MRKLFSPRCFVRALVLLAAMAGVVCAQAVAQSVPAPGAAAAGEVQGPPPHQHGNLGEELTGMTGREVHIFFIHGIGSDGPNVHDSLALRKSICAYLKDCVTPAGEQVGNYDYADEEQFAPDSPAPALRYMGKPVWRTAEEWHAAAPFVVHYRLKLARGGTVYVDELNWWPLMFALKCRQIVGEDTRLTGPNVQRIKTCATREPDAAVAGRFVAYDWIPAADAEHLLTLPKRGALANRLIKHSLSDWQFPDAVMVLGPLNTLLVDGIRQLILKSVAEPGNNMAVAEGASPLTPAPNQEFVIVAQSLGSSLIFSALDIDVSGTPTPRVVQSAGAFAQVLRQTSLVYFFANQVPLMELANLDATERYVSHLEVWGRLHCEFEKQERPGVPCRLPKIVALSDPSDLLTWRVPKLDTVEVQNYRVKNAPHWFWLFEDPMKAHIDYSSNKQAIQDMLHPRAGDGER